MYTIIKLSAFSIQDSIKVLMNCGKFHLIFLHAQVNASDITSDHIFIRPLNSGNSAGIIELSHLYIVCGGFHSCGLT